MASGDTKTEALLNILGHGGTGNEYRGSGNTKTQNYILDAIDRINAIDPSGGSSAIKVLTDADANFSFDGIDYIAVWLLDGGIYTLAEDATVSLLINVEYGDDPAVVETTGDEFASSERPLIISNNDLEDTGINLDINVYSSSTNLVYNITKEGVINEVLCYSGVFNGTNGYDKGDAGLVPAPEVTDVDKFLCSDGGWQPAAANIVSLTITGASGSDVNVTASEYLDDLVTKIDSGVECVFKLTIPLDSGFPLGGTFLFRVSNYFPDRSNIWCFSPFYDNPSNVMYMLKLEYVPVNQNYHTQNAVVHIFMP